MADRLSTPETLPAEIVRRALIVITISPVAGLVFWGLTTLMGDDRPVLGSIAFAALVLTCVEAAKLIEHRWWPKKPPSGPTASSRSDTAPVFVKERGPR